MLSSRPDTFPNGSTYLAWCADNCDRCVKHEPDGIVDDSGTVPCAVDFAMLAEQFGNATQRQLNLIDKCLPQKGNGSRSRCARLITERPKYKRVHKIPYCVGQEALTI